MCQFEIVLINLFSYALLPLLYFELELYLKIKDNSCFKLWSVIMQKLKDKKSGVDCERDNSPSEFKLDRN